VQTSASVDADIRVGRCRHPRRSVRMLLVELLFAFFAPFCLLQIAIFAIFATVSLILLH
jgi:hypothetical protein